MEETPIQNTGINMAPQLLSAKKSGGLVLKVAGIIILLGVIVGGVLLGTRVWDPLWSPFRPSPEKVITAMSERMKAVKSSHSEVKISSPSEAKINVDIKKPNPGKAVIDFSFDSDISDLENPKIQGDLGVLFIGDPFGTGSQETISAKVKIKEINQEAYFNVSEFNSPSIRFTFAMMGVDLDNIIGNWFKVPIGDQLSQYSDTQKTALMEQMEKIISESKVYVVKNQLPDQKIEGQKMYHYLVALDNEKTAELMGNLMSEIAKEINSTEQQASELGASLSSGAIKGVVSEFLDKAGEITAELFIGKKDNLLYGIKMEKNIDFSKIDNNIQGVFDISIEINNSKFNQPVTVEIPAIFKNFDEIFPKTPVKSGKL